MKKDVLGIKIDDISIDQIVDTVKEWLSQKGRHYIVTPNPEIVMMAQKDLQLKEIINHADLSLPDGNGLKLTTNIKCLSPGVDVMEALVKMASIWGLSVGFLGGKGDVAKVTAECLKKKYPKLTVKYALSGPIIPTKVKTYTNNDLSIPDQVLTNRCDILFVALGPPKQEHWIARNFKNIPVKVAMGVGGSFDYISGRVLRAPQWIRNLQLEWLFRLIMEPWRIKRQVLLIKYLFLLLSRSNKNMVV